MKRWWWVVLLLLLGACRTAHPATSEPSEPGASSAQPTGGTPLPPHPPSVSERPNGCQSDAECQAGQVCAQCGDVGSCMTGCRADTDCERDQRCEQVQCVRCPCPSQCHAALGE
jgi:hypothetical protein